MYVLVWYMTLYEEVSVRLAPIPLSNINSLFVIRLGFRYVNLLCINFHFSIIYLYQRQIFHILADGKKTHNIMLDVVEMYINKWKRE